MTLKTKHLNIPWDLGSGGPDNATPLFGCRLLWKVDEDARYSARHAPFAYHGLFFTWDGCGIMEWDGRRTELRPFSAFIIKKGTPCFYACPANKIWRFYCVQFLKPESLSPWGLEFNTLYDSRSGRDLTGLFEEMRIESLNRKPSHLVKIDGLMNDFFVAFERRRLESLSSSRSPAEAARNWMLAHPGEKLDLEEHIAASGLCRTVFFKAFKSLTGMSPVNYFLNERLKTAGHMLEQPRPSIRKISETLGFYDEFYFSKMFRKRFGRSPSEFRKTLPGSDGSELRR